MTVFFLVLTFYNIFDGGFGATTITTPYPSIIACETAAKEAGENYSGGARIDWTCVPSKI